MLALGWQAAAHIKLIPISLLPFGREVMPIDEVGAGAGVAVEPRRSART